MTTRKKQKISYKRGRIYGTTDGDIVLFIKRVKNISHCALLDEEGKPIRLIEIPTKQLEDITSIPPKFITLDITR